MKETTAKKAPKKRKERDLGTPTVIVRYLDETPEQVAQNRRCVEAALDMMWRKTYVEKSYKGLDGEVQHGLHEGQEAGRRCGSMNEIGKTKQRQTLITPKGRETFRLLMIG